MLDGPDASLVSLPTLKHLPLHHDKLDHSLLFEMPASRGDGATIRAVVGACYALCLTIVAEGVEAKVQHVFNSGIGDDKGKDVLFSPSLPAGQSLPALSAVRS